MNNITDEQLRLRIEYLKSDLQMTWYQQYAGSKSVGCVSHWIKAYTGNLSLAENCCADINKVTTSPWSKELVANYTWVEDSPNVFRPKFEFAEKYSSAQNNQDIYEKYILNKGIDWDKPWETGSLV